MNFRILKEVFKKLFHPEVENIMFILAYINYTQQRFHYNIFMYIMYDNLAGLSCLYTSNPKYTL